MAAITFPNSPSADQVFTVGSRSWKWNGSKWASNNATLSATSPITYSNGNIAFSGIAIDDISDVTVSTPSSGQIISYNGTVWVNSAAPKAVAYFSPTAPSSPETGQLWYDTYWAKLLMWNGSTWFEITI